MGHKKLLMNNSAKNIPLPPTEGEPVTNGLVCWLDARDGKYTDTVWRDRQGNSNFNMISSFDLNTMWDGMHFKVINSSTTKKYGFENTSLNIPLTKATINIRGTFKKISSYPYLLSMNNRLIKVLIETKLLKVIGTSTAQFSIDLNTTFDLAFTFNNGVISTFINGVKQSKTCTTNVQSINSLSIFCDQITTDLALRQFIGDCTSFKIYNRALNDVEVEHNFNYECSIDRTQPKNDGILSLEEYVSHVNGIGIANVRVTKSSINTIRYITGGAYYPNNIVGAYSSNKSLKLVPNAKYSLKFSVNHTSVFVVSPTKSLDPVRNAETNEWVFTCDNTGEIITIVNAANITLESEMTLRLLEAPPEIQWEEFATTGDSMGSLATVVPLWDGTDVSTLASGTLIAEIEYTVNTSSRNVQLALRKSSTSSVNTLLNGTLKPSSGSIITVKVYLADPAKYSIRMNIHDSSGALVEEGTSTVALGQTYTGMSRATPATGNIRVKRHLI